MAGGTVPAGTQGSGGGEHEDEVGGSDGETRANVDEGSQVEDGESEASGGRDDATGLAAQDDGVRPDEVAPGPGTPGARSTRTDDTQPLPGVEP